MWARLSGFHLTKFISNKQELLLSIPKTQRRISVKDQDLSDQLANKKALGICLETGEDAFTFKIELNEKPLTKSMMLTGIEKLKICMHIFSCTQKYVCVHLVCATISSMPKFCTYMCVHNPCTLWQCLWTQLIFHIEQIPFAFLYLFLRNVTQFFSSVCK